MRQPKYRVGQLVEKWTGQYGGPGRVRGIANEDGQPLRYIVGHRIEGGFGEFYHIYAEGNLREPEGFDGLPIREPLEITEETRTGQAEPDEGASS